MEVAERAAPDASPVAVEACRTSREIGSFTVPTFGVVGRLVPVGPDSGTYPRIVRDVRHVISYPFATASARDDAQRRSGRSSAA